MKIDFNRRINGQSGRFDALRVLSTNGGFQDDDLSPQVLFSSNWPSMRCEMFTRDVTGISASTNFNRSGTIVLARDYKTFPCVLAVYRYNANAKTIYPFVYARSYQTGSEANGFDPPILAGRAYFVVNVESLAAPKRYRIGWEIGQFNKASFLNGQMMFYAFGETT